MTYVHLAHDCHVGDEVVIANGTQLAGHVTIHDRAVLSGLNAVHQFVTIGSYAFVGGGSRVNQDIPPYVKAVGNPMELYGLNSIGLQRAGFPGETIAALKRALEAHGAAMPADMAALRLDLRYGAIRLALVPLLRHSGGAFAAHDPDGHLFVVSRPAASSQSLRARQLGTVSPSTGARA